VGPPVVALAGTAATSNAITAIHECFTPSPLLPA
jgi:hypothetical protein